MLQQQPNLCCDSYCVAPCVTQAGQSWIVPICLFPQHHWCTYVLARGAGGPVHRSKDDTSEVKNKTFLNCFYAMQRLPHLTKACCCPGKKAASAIIFQHWTRGRVDFFFKLWFCAFYFDWQWALQGLRPRSS